ncbi:MAG TPA: ATP-binding protein [Ktedonobacteraceae bacterium]|nr:ATP-binding protein [Ktedonobacteraceae bacterium]
MMEVEQLSELISAAGVLTALLTEFSTVIDYRTLRDNLPRRLASLLKCRCVLLYQRMEETLQFASGSFDDKPGWSAALLSFAHINPINLNSDLPEACAWRERHPISTPASHPTHVAMPLIYRQRGIGVLVAIRDCSEEKMHDPDHWHVDEIHALGAVAGVVALLLENTRLLERDRERIHELALLNNISSQMSSAMYEPERMRSVVIQRAREITTVDLCELIEPAAPTDAIAWISPSLRELLLHHFQEQRSLVPLIIERPGDASGPSVNDYLDQLPTNIKTFFAAPLLSGRAMGKRGSSLLRGSLGAMQELAREPRVLGIIVGGYYRTWKLRHEESALLQVLASQASAVLENMHLMTEVIEARNEARKLLRQVLDDQRLKELILEGIPSGLITTDSNGYITTFNRAAEAILGYHPYEVLGQPLYKFLDLDSSFSVSRTIHAVPLLHSTLQQQNTFQAVIQAGGVQSGTLLTLDRHDHEIVLDIDLLPLHDDLGERIGMLATFTDMTSIHRLEEEKRRLDRLATLGEMAANVAHEVRNPLASIKTSIQMLRDDLLGSERSTEQICSIRRGEQTDGAQESVEVMLKEVERLDTIVRDLLLFAKPRQLHRVPCNIIELSDHVLQLIQMQCAEANVIVHRVYEDVPQIWVDIGQIEQVLLNLYMNAIQAMPDGGILTISCHCISAESALCDAADVLQTSTYTSSESWRNKQNERENGSAISQWLEIIVSDTGIGIAPEQLERIFQPFFTTKAHGIGLGLAITRRLVEDHSGYIRVESQFGYGATISVRLPFITDATMCSQHHTIEDWVEEDGPGNSYH